MIGVHARVARVVPVAPEEDGAAARGMLVDAPRDGAHHVVSAAPGAEHLAVQEHRHAHTPFHGRHQFVREPGVREQVGLDLQARGGGAQKVAQAREAVVRRDEGRHLGGGGAASRVEEALAIPARVGDAHAEFGIQGIADPIGGRVGVQTTAALQAALAPEHLPLGGQVVVEAEGLGGRPRPARLRLGPARFPDQRVDHAALLVQQHQLVAAVVENEQAIAGRGLPIEGEVRREAELPGEALHVARDVDDGAGRQRAPGREAPDALVVRDRPAVQALLAISGIDESEGLAALALPGLGGIVADFVQKQARGRLLAPEAAGLGFAAAAAEGLLPGDGLPAPLAAFDAQPVLAGAGAQIPVVTATCEDAAQPGQLVPFPQHGMLAVGELDAELAALARQGGQPGHAIGVAANGDHRQRRQLHEAIAPEGRLGDEIAGPRHPALLPAQALLPQGLQIPQGIRHGQHGALGLQAQQSRHPDEIAQLGRVFPAADAQAGQGPLLGIGQVEIAEEVPDQDTRHGQPTALPGPGIQGEPRMEFGPVRGRRLLGAQRGGQADQEGEEEAKTRAHREPRS